jgi:hypothetical protein
VIWLEYVVKMDAEPVFYPLSFMMALSVKLRFCFNRGQTGAPGLVQVLKMDGLRWLQDCVSI